MSGEGVSVWLAATEGFRAGILFDQSILAQPWFSVFATFVAINTLGYVAVTVAKMLPMPRRRRRDLRNRRAETRGITPASDSHADPS